MRQIININKDWRFSKKPQSTPTTLPTDWESVDLPHTWNGTDGQDGGNDYRRGTSTYAVRLPAPDADGDVWLEFRGVNSSAQIHLNGTLLATHEGGYSTFRVPLAEALRDAHSDRLYIRTSPHDTIAVTIVGRSGVDGSLSDEDNVDLWLEIAR